MPLTPESIRAALSDQPLIKQVLHTHSIGSTNDLARQLANDGAEEIALISTNEQTAGRGRQGRSWFTPRGSALAISLLTRPAIPAPRAMLLTMLAGLAVVEGIEDATNLHLDLKWPNDVVSIANDQMPNAKLRKVGGILTECSFQNDQIEYAIVGIGLNVDVDFSQQESLRNSATSLIELSGLPIDQLVVLKAIVTRFIDHYSWLGNEVKLRDAWRARLINLGQHVSVQSGAEILEGLAEAVD
ncbi:MAG TPA: biotin--[acetyl-CoA-carboxylase] ligase, partial [Anaerolineae bacterium]|nr:biotin--[acetyl-CoA-carboxylase] ligase [Anaerolineae bacterium]